MGANYGIYNINLNQMKQETINLIKSMTGQGFLVIVDPETYNGNETTVVISKKHEEERTPEPRVIFTNCAGEVFTEEDKKKDVTVWWLGLSTKSIICGRFSSITGSYGAGSTSTDIFRSRKSLLKYLYETCE